MCGSVRDRQDPTAKLVSLQPLDWAHAASSQATNQVHPFGCGYAWIVGSRTARISWQLVGVRPSAFAPVAMNLMESHCSPSLFADGAGASRVTL